MSKFGDDLIRALGEALAHATGKGKAALHALVDPAKVRKAANSHKPKWPSDSMRLSGHCKLEQGARNISGSAAAPLSVIVREPAAVK